ncbi:MAG: MATE family efflux transporter [Candidatus Actinomarina sp.]|tara:strand:- start:734 stop:2014 length:1281 start_codon:yes stop_codon:yes gene_type:complete
MINNVRKDIWVNSYPIFLWLALEPIVGLIDSKIASVINLETLSAIGIGETIYFVFIWVFIFLAYGTTPLVSSLNTKKEINQLNYFIKFGRNVSVILGLGSFFILFLSSDYLISTFQPTDNIQLLSSDYLIYRCIGLPFYLVNMHSTAVLRGLKYAKITFYSALIVSISNIVFSLFFGLFLGLGAGGIGFASSLAFFCASIYSTMILKKQLNHHPSNQENIDKNTLRKKFFNVGVYILIRSLFLTIFMAYLRNRSSLMSMQEIALQHILLQLWSVGYIFVDAIAIASQTLISELVSKKEKYQKSVLQKELITVTTVISLLLALTTFLFLEYFVEIFGANNFNLYINLQLRALVALSLFIGCYAFLWDGVLLGLDRSKQFSFLTIVSSIAGFLVCAYLLKTQNTISTLWIGLNVSLVFRSLLGYVYQK